MYRLTDRGLGLFRWPRRYRQDVHTGQINIDEMYAFLVCIFNTVMFVVTTLFMLHVGIFKRRQCIGLRKSQQATWVALPLFVQMSFQLFVVIYSFFLPCDYNHVHSSYHQLLLSLQVDLRHFTCSQLWITTRRRKRGILTCFEANPKNKSCFAYIPDIETKIHQCILKFIVRFPCQLLSVVLLLGLHLAVMCCLNGLKKNH